MDQKLVCQEVPLIIGVSLLLWALAADGSVSRVDGLLFVALLGAYVVLLIRRSLCERADQVLFKNPSLAMNGRLDLPHRNDIGSTAGQARA